MGRSLMGRLLGVAGGIILTMKDWNDRMTSRLPQARNRTIRLGLKTGEGQLNLAMPRETILRMAHEYGTRAGELLVRRFERSRHGVKQAWREHLYVRSMIELRAITRHLRGYTHAVQSSGNTLPLNKVQEQASRRRALFAFGEHADRSGGALKPLESQALGKAVQAVQALEAELTAQAAEFGPYRPTPEPELRLRPPV